MIRVAFVIGDYPAEQRKLREDVAKGYSSPEVEVGIVSVPARPFDGLTPAVNLAKRGRLDRRRQKDHASEAMTETCVRFQLGRVCSGFARTARFTSRTPALPGVSSAPPRAGTFSRPATSSRYSVCVATHSISRSKESGSSHST